VRHGINIHEIAVSVPLLTAVF